MSPVLYPVRVAGTDLARKRLGRDIVVLKRTTNIGDRAQAVGCVL